MARENAVAVSPGDEDRTELVLDDPLVRRCPVAVHREHAAKAGKLLQPELVGGASADGVLEPLTGCGMAADAVGPYPGEHLLLVGPPREQQRLVAHAQDVAGERQVQPGVLVVARQLGSGLAGGGAVLGDEDDLLGVRVGRHSAVRHGRCHLLLACR